jgi:hypothetical protein
VPRWAKALLAATILVGGGLTVILWTKSTNARRARDVETRTQAIRRETDERPRLRPVLTGTAEAGNAWPDYALALKEISADRKLQQQFTQLQSHDYTRDREAAERVLAGLPNIFEHLRRGAHREEGRWVDEPPLTVCMSLGTVTVTRARLFREEGRDREALDLLTDFLQFAGDIRRNAGRVGDMVGSGLCIVTFWELADLVLAGMLAPTDLAALARSLETFDSSWHDARLSLREDFFELRDAINKEKVTPVHAWRYGFSTAALKADAVLILDSLIEESIRSESLPWRETLAAYERLNRKVKESSNRAVRRGLDLAPRCGSQHRTARAKLRILRAAVQVRIDGTVPEFDDPFGAKIRHAREGSSLKLWSVGRDGVDNGGQGAWRNYRESGDIVLEVK